MDKLVCLVGPSGSGKTTIAKKLEEDGYNIIHSYTTRKPRHEGEWGHTFIDKLIEKENRIIGFDNQNRMILRAYKGDKGEMIAFKKLYNDLYFATKEQYQNKGVSIYTVCPDGVKQVKNNVTDAEVITIFLMCDEEIRISRLQQRYWKNTNLKTAHELNAVLYADERIEKDREIFSTCKCDYVLDANRDICDVVSDIKNIIGK